MKKNTAIFNTITKKINFNFNGEEFEVDLREGDLEDNWNQIEMKNGDVFDVNLSWQGEDDDETERPSFSAYPVYPNNDAEGTWSADWSDNRPIKIVEVIGDKNYYFNDKPHEFNHMLPTRYEVFDENDVLQLKTKRFNKAVDTATTQKVFHQKEWYVIAIDSNNARKNLSKKNEQTN